MSYKEHLSKEERSLRTKKRRGWTPLRTPGSDLPDYSLFSDHNLEEVIPVASAPAHCVLQWRQRPKVVRMHAKCGNHKASAYPPMGTGWLS